MKNKNYAYIAIVVAVVLLAAILILMNGRERVDETNGERVYCTEEQRLAEVCTMEYAPVCGYHEDGLPQTYPNSCFACMNPQVIYYIVGEC